jgi:hypothetical protein
MNMDSHIDLRPDQVKALTMVGFKLKPITPMTDEELFKTLFDKGLLTNGKIDELRAKVKELENKPQTFNEKTLMQINAVLVGKMLEQDDLIKQALGALKLTSPFSKHSREQYQEAITALEQHIPLGKS